MIKILATRLNTFLYHYIHLDHVGFVPHRQASDQTRQIIDIISTVHYSWDAMGDRWYMLLSIDLPKAFDSLSWDYLFYVLGRYGLVTRFLPLLWTLYSVTTASPLVKGNSSQIFKKISRGPAKVAPFLQFYSCHFINFI